MPGGPDRIRSFADKNHLSAPFVVSRRSPSRGIRHDDAVRSDGGCKRFLSARFQRENQEKEKTSESRDKVELFSFSSLAFLPHFIFARFAKGSFPKPSYLKRRTGMGSGWGGEKAVTEMVGVVGHQIVGG
ncbi:hypothetical protein HPP92_007784 [Vanilla planifolia]|uniref:Uncharacterized protein n=1 Tax=Vanilla planifolia TaxID=51239 RepID=A0A835RMM9_VANPL|nr:hypothetical protein HPP92_007784 [Vanilla planifolia]